MGKLYLGCSGYDYPDDWKGVFYPEKTPHSKFLEYYKTQFNALELNGTWRRIPTKQNMIKMVERTEKQLKFAVKAYRGLTHEIIPEQIETIATEFKIAMEPLLRDDLLLSVLLQFPQAFHYADKERKYLDRLIKLMAGLPLTLEIRHKEWQKASVYEGLRQRNVGWCVVDTPDLYNLPKIQQDTKLEHISNLKTLPKIETILTNNSGYFRAHGRNEFWYEGDNVTRYAYLYNDDELLELKPIIELLMSNATLVQVYFNNHAHGYATINAKKMELLLKG